VVFKIWLKSFVFIFYAQDCGTKEYIVPTVISLKISHV